MRLGSYACRLTAGSLAHKTYGKLLISERHRHRFEVNNHYKNILEEGGLKFTGLNPESGLVEMMEIPEHPWFLTCQFHPEFKSKPLLAHPLFAGFVKASLAARSGLRKETPKPGKKSKDAALLKRARKRGASPLSLRTS